MPRGSDAVKLLTLRAFKDKAKLGKRISIITDLDISDSTFNNFLKLLRLSFRKFLTMTLEGIVSQLRRKIFSDITAETPLWRIEQWADHQESVKQKHKKLTGSLLKKKIKGTPFSDENLQKAFDFKTLEELHTNSINRSDDVPELKIRDFLRCFKDLDPSFSNLVTFSSKPLDDFLAKLPEELQSEITPKKTLLEIKYSLSNYKTMVRSSIKSIAENVMSVTRLNSNEEAQILQAITLGQLQTYFIQNTFQDYKNIPCPILITHLGLLDYTPATFKKRKLSKFKLPEIFSNDIVDENTTLLSLSLKVLKENIIALAQFVNLPIKQIYWRCKNNSAYAYGVMSKKAFGFSTKVLTLFLVAIGFENITQFNREDFENIKMKLSINDNTTYADLNPSILVLLKPELELAQQSIKKNIEQTKNFASTNSQSVNPGLFFSRKRVVEAEQKIPEPPAKKQFTIALNITEAAPTTQTPFNFWQDFSEQDLASNIGEEWKNVLN